MKLASMTLKLPKSVTKQLFSYRKEVQLPERIIIIRDESQNQSVGVIQLPMVQFAGLVPLPEASSVTTIWPRNR